MKLVSVVIPSYNGADWVLESVDTALKQTWENLEVIVVLDGSTDRSEEILTNYHPRVRAIRQDNAGPAVARNTGIRASKGDYIALLDDDDLWAADKIEQQVALMEAHPSVGVVFTNYKPFGAAAPYRDGFGRSRMLPTLPRRAIGDKQWLIRGEDAYAALLKDLFSWTSTLLIRRSLLDRVGLYDEALRYAGEDWQMCLRLARVSDYAFIDSVLALRRERGGSLSKLGKDEGQSIIALNNLLKVPDLQGSQRRLAHLRLAQSHFGLGFLTRDQGEREDSAQHFRSAARHAWAARGEQAAASLAMKAALHALKSRLS